MNSSICGDLPMINESYRGCSRSVKDAVWSRELQLLMLFGSTWITDQCSFDKLLWSCWLKLHCATLWFRVRCFQWLSEIQLYFSWTAVHRSCRSRYFQLRLVSSFKIFLRSCFCCWLTLCDSVRLSQTMTCINTFDHFCWCDERQHPRLRLFVVWPLIIWRQ